MAAKLMQTGNVGSSEPSELGEFDMKVEVEAGVPSRRTRQAAVGELVW